jgi:hypothetical protein
MSLKLSRRRRDDRGAVAVMVALLAVVLLSISAMSVDLGNAWQTKRQVQAGSDLAAEAGAGVKGANLPQSGPLHSCSYGNAGALATDQAVKDIANYLAHQEDPDGTGNYSTLVANLPAQLTDCNMDNGEVVYGQPKKTGSTWSVTYNKNQLSLVAPQKHVDFGLAGIMGIDGVDVNGVSTVEIRSPKMATLPFYAFSGCDYGPQTLQQPNNGQSASTVNLYAPTEPQPANTNNALLTSVTPNSYPVETSGTVLEPITIAGTNLTGVTQIGFFESGNVGTGPAPVTIDSTKFTINGAGTQITVPDIPDQTRGVAGVQEFWYIRVMKNGQWSAVYTGPNGHPVLNTPILTIGDPPLVCGQGSSAGNFGTIKLSHNGFNGWDSIGAANVALGLDSTLALYPPGGPADGTCSSAQTTTVLWTLPGTNCVDTDTGMSANVATGGFLGLGSSKVPTGEYLLKPRGKTKCANGGTTEATTVLMNQTINNDTLTCFFTNNTVHVGDVDAGNYTQSGPVISDAIYDSPRFGYVPVLPVQPANGGSKKYQIIDFRACFITDQPASAVKGDPPNTGNGIVTDNNGIRSIEVIFLNPNALPNPPVKNGTINYVGSGDKIPLLVN